MAFTYFGSAFIPGDEGSGVSSPIGFTPPGSMVTGDLCIMAGFTKGTATDWAIPVTGGQSWNTTDIGQILVSTNRNIFVAWATWNGTWSANPQLSVTVTQCFTGFLLIARPDASEVVAFDTFTSSNGVAPSSPFDFTITGITTATNDEFVLNVCQTPDDNEMVKVTSAGWMDQTFSHDNTGGTDLGIGVTCGDLAIAGSTGDVVWNESLNGGDAFAGFTAAWSAIAAAGATSLISDPNPLKHLLVR